MHIKALLQLIQIQLMKGIMEVMEEDNKKFGKTTKISLNNSLRNNKLNFNKDNSIFKI